MFIDDLIDLMTGDPSINALATGGIRYEHLPVDFNKDKDWIVFSYTLEEQSRVLDNTNITSDYRLQVQISSKQLENVMSISDLFRPYIISYDDGSKIRDIYFIDDDVSFDTEKEMYYQTTNYNVLYIG